MLGPGSMQCNVNSQFSDFHLQHDSTASSNVGAGWEAQCASVHCEAAFSRLTWPRNILKKIAAEHSQSSQSNVSEGCWRGDAILREHKCDEETAEF